MGTESNELKVFNQLFAAQSVLHIFPTVAKMAEYAVHALKNIPGVALCAISLPLLEEHIGDPFANPDRPSPVSAGGETDPGRFLPQLRPGSNELSFYLQTGNEFFGVVVISVSSSQEFEPYRSAAANFTNIVAIHIEYILQTAQITNHRQLLEREVEERTAELRREVAERKHAEEALRDVSQYSLNLIETSLDPLVTINADGKITDANTATETITGVHRQSLVGSDFADYFTEPEMARAGYKRVLAQGQIIDYPLAIRHTSGAIADVLYNASLYRDKQGNVVGVFAAARDITERKKAEENIQRLLKEKELVLKEVHHRIKNNMNTMMSLLSLQAGAMKDAGAVAALTDARRRMQSMMVLYDKLYRSEGFRTLSLRAYLPPLIHEIVANFPNAGAVSIETRMDEFVLDAKTLSSLGIIVNELVTNAMKYAFTGRNSGAIRVSAAMKERHLTVIVQDNGVGLPESFDLGASAGFGLRLVHLLTEQLRGGIRVERGEGTTFILECDVRS